MGIFLTPHLNSYSLFSSYFSRLAGVYIGQLNYPKAEATLKESIGITERTLGTAHPHAITRWAALATLYERMGRVQDSINAWDHQKKIAEIRRKEEASWK
ncbi:MAG: tetratricopeptide repeat protein [Actinobacteria bacterium]|nr:tetratricopeptide repeat protein [Actinomycetota bacterium]